MRFLPVLVVLFSLVAATGCASSQSDVDESARLVGRAGDVRIDALITNLHLAGGSNLNLTYDVENLRSDSIAIADIVPEVSFDPETGIITVLLGSEVPGNDFLPRLELIRSGEVKSFSRGASLNVGSTARTPPRAIQIRLSYLKDVTPFESLVGITEKAVYDPDFADELFLTWVDNIRSVETNAVPLRERERSRDDVTSPSSRTPRSRPPGAPF